MLWGKSLTLNATHQSNSNDTVIYNNIFVSLCSLHFIMYPMNVFLSNTTFCICPIKCPFSYELPWDLFQSTNNNGPSLPGALNRMHMQLSQVSSTLPTCQDHTEHTCHQKDTASSRLHISHRCSGTCNNLWRTHFQGGSICWRGG